MSDKLVVKAIQKSVIAFNATLGTPLPLKTLGRTFEPPDDQKYFEIVHIPSNVDSTYWNNEKLYQGIFRLVLHWPNGDEGVYEPLDTIALIEAYYLKTRALRNGGLVLKIYKNPNYTGMIEAGHEMLFPVSMSYRSFNI